jgi:hypothetical protein
MKALWHVAALTLCLSAPSFSMPCDSKEFAEYKDQALTAYGRRSMATDYCRWQIRHKAAVDLAELANKHGRVLDAKEARSDVSSCRAELSKIKNALIAAKADDALAYINRDCKGELGVCAAEGEGACGMRRVAGMFIGYDELSSV